MKNILVLSEIFPPQNGGSGRWLWEIFKRIDSYKVSFVADKNISSSEFDTKSEKLIYRINLKSSQWGIKSFVGLFYYAKNIIKILAICKKQRIHHVFCGRCLPEGLMAYAVNKISGVRYSCFVHGEDIETARSSRELTVLTRAVMSKSDNLICNSQNSASIVRDKWDMPEKKIKVMYPGVDVHHFTNNKDESRPSGWDDKLILLTVGRLQKRKGHDAMISALPAIKKKYPNIHYCIVGDGPEKESLKHHVSELRLDDCVEFIYDLSDKDLATYYRNCSLFILPNRAVGKDIEGFGMVLIEAQASGKPVVAGDSGGTSETMIVGKTGFIINCENKENIAEALISILDETDLEVMGEQGRRFVEQNFDWSKLHGDFVDLLNKNLQN